MKFVKVLHQWDFRNFQSPPQKKVRVNCDIFGKQLRLYDVFLINFEEIISLFANFYSNTKSLHLFWEESRLNSANFTEKVSFCVNSWKSYPSPKSSAQLPFAMNFMSALAMTSIAIIASTSTVKSQQWIMRDKERRQWDLGPIKYKHEIVIGLVWIHHQSCALLGPLQRWRLLLQRVCWNMNLPALSLWKENKHKP